jgi:DNA-binding sugar fermentation-stimulating protein
MTQEHGQWVSLDTGLPTAAVRLALLDRLLPEFAAYEQVRPEFTYGRSRLDFLLTHGESKPAQHGGGPDRRGAEEPRNRGDSLARGGLVAPASGPAADAALSLAASGRPNGAPRPCLLEVKSVTLVVDGLALFPDAVSQRATRHLRELMRAAAQGYRAAVLFVVQRQDAAAVAANGGTDPNFAAALAEAAQAGVELHARTCRVSPEGVVLGSTVPVLTSAPTSPPHET